MQVSRTAQGGICMIRVLLHGYKGRLGRAIASAMAESPDVEVVAGIDVEAAAGAVCIFPTYTDIFDCDMPVDVIVDCTVAHAVPRVLHFAEEKETAVVICTTGLDEATLAQVEATAKSVPVFRSANMSLGINLMAELLEKMVRVLGDSGFDPEIIEKHHNKKLDAPSGTALILADAINGAADGAYEYVYDRSAVRQERGAKELGIHAVRGGTIVGEHTVLFAGKDEVLEIKHTANSKEVFAIGTVKAVRFLHTKPAGLYSMRDLMTEA